MLEFAGTLRSSSRQICKLKCIEAWVAAAPERKGLKSGSPSSATVGILDRTLLKFLLEFGLNINADSFFAKRINMEINIHPKKSRLGILSFWPDSSATALVKLYSNSFFLIFSVLALSNQYGN